MRFCGRKLAICERILLILGIFILSGCGDGQSGGPSQSGGANDIILNQNEITIHASNGATDSVEPYRRQNDSGDRTFSVSLDRGVNLIDFSVVAFYDVDKQKDAILTIRDSKAKVKHYIADKSKATISDESPLHLFFLEEGGDYTIEVDVPDAFDIWRVNFVHKSQLSNMVQAALKDPVVSSGIDGDDILFRHQWHLKNTGQNEYVVFDAVYGNDINVEPVWQQDYLGSGIMVAVIDEGVEINHPDLIENIDIRKSWNYNTQSHDTTPSNRTNAHGTTVARIIAASGWNGIGGRGVAPKAKIVSYNMLESQNIVQWDLALESLVRNIEYIDIYNNSWGLRADGTLSPNPNTTSSLYYQFANQLAYGSKHGREGRGSIYVKSAGNDRKKYNETTNEFEDNYWNANFSPIQVERYMIVVGASDADGSCSWYSTPGANLLVNAPGGDGQMRFLEVDQHLIVTTDLTGKHAGHDYQDDNLIDFHFRARGNENYDYTNRMNGTSAAGPIVAGVVALMLEANPNLTWRDVRYILATTATKNGRGYIQNGAEHSFSNDYGFGRVNAKSAVHKAVGWHRLADEKSIVRGAIDTISLGRLAKTSTTFHIDENLLVEYVNVEFSLKKKIGEDLSDASNIKVELISPQGMSSILVDAPNGLNSDAVFHRTRLGSNAFLDESSGGTWTLSIGEVNMPDEERAFRIENLRLEIYGREP